MEDLPKGMEHIDRRELYTSLPARIIYLQQFLEFGAGNCALIVVAQWPTILTKRLFR